MRLDAIGGAKSRHGRILELIGPLAATKAPSLLVSKSMTPDSPRRKKTRAPIELDRALRFHRLLERAVRPNCEENIFEVRRRSPERKIGLVHLIRGFGDDHATLGSAYTIYREDVSSSGTVLYGQIQFSNSNPITSDTDLKTVGPRRHR